jgi:hypothetical protein
MIISDFVDSFVQSNPDIKFCYLAIIKDLDDTFVIEVEVNEGSIGSSYFTYSSCVETARKIADVIEKDLSCGFGIVVFKTREKWEEYCYGE